MADKISQRMFSERGAYNYSFSVTLADIRIVASAIIWIKVTNHWQSFEKGISQGLLYFSVPKRYSIPSWNLISHINGCKIYHMLLFSRYRMLFSQLIKCFLGPINYGLWLQDVRWLKPQIQ